MGLSATHTFAELAVYASTYKDIHSRLTKAGHTHAFLPNGRIDMHGIGLCVDDSLKISKYSVGDRIVADGSESEECEVKAVFEADLHGSEIGYVAQRTDDGMLIVIMEDEASDYTEIP